MLRSARILCRHWKLTAIAIFSLSIAMALGVVSLSLSNTFLLLTPAAPEPDRLVMIYGRASSVSVDQVSFPDYQYFRQNNHVFTDLAAAPNSISLSQDDNFNHQTIKILSRPVSANYLTVMGIRPLLGRFFTTGEDQADAAVAVMTWSCWKRLGADPHIVGKTVSLAQRQRVQGEEFALHCVPPRFYTDSDWVTSLWAQKASGPSYPANA